MPTWAVGSCFSNRSSAYSPLRWVGNDKKNKRRKPVSSHKSLRITRRLSLTKRWMAWWVIAPPMSSSMSCSTCRRVVQGRWHSYANQYDLLSYAISQIPGVHDEHFALAGLIVVVSPSADGKMTCPHQKLDCKYARYFGTRWIVWPRLRHSRQQVDNMRWTVAQTTVTVTMSTVG